MPRRSNGRAGTRTSARYDRIVEVYFEGLDDLRAFKEWVRGRPPEEQAILQLQEAQGCKGVVAQVEAAQLKVNAPPTFGVVDRDALISSEELRRDREGAVQRFLEPDDHAMEAASPFPSAVFVLTRWELENCLFADLESLWKHCSNASKAPPSMGEFVARMLAECQRLLPLSAALIHQRKHGEEAIAEGHASHLHVPEAVEAALRASLHYAGDALTAYKDKIAAFDLPGATDQDRYDALLRIVDGKRLLERFLLHFTNLKRCEEARKELISSLAERQWRAGRIDKAVTRVLDGIAAQL